MLRRITSVFVLLLAAFVLPASSHAVALDFSDITEEIPDSRWRLNDVTAGVDMVVSLDSMTGGGTITFFQPTGFAGGPNDILLIQLNRPSATDINATFTAEFVVADTTTSTTVTNVQLSCFDLDFHVGITDVVVVRNVSSLTLFPDSHLTKIDLTGGDYKLRGGIQNNPSENPRGGFRFTYDSVSSFTFTLGIEDGSFSQGRSFFFEGDQSLGLTPAIIEDLIITDITEELPLLRWRMNDVKSGVDMVVNLTSIVGGSLTSFGSSSSVGSEVLEIGLQRPATSAVVADFTAEFVIADTTTPTTVGDIRLTSLDLDLDLGVTDVVTVRTVDALTLFADSEVTSTDLGSGDFELRGGGENDPPNNRRGAFQFEYFSTGSFDFTVSIESGTGAQAGSFYFEADGSSGQIAGKSVPALGTTAMIGLTLLTLSMGAALTRGRWAMIS